MQVCVAVRVTNVRTTKFRKLVKSLNRMNPARTPVGGVGHVVRRGGILQTVQ